MLNTESSKKTAAKDMPFILGRINDVLAVVCICTLVAWNVDMGILFVVQMAFFVSTILYSYISNRKLSAICVWAVLFYGYCVLSIMWAYDEAEALKYLVTMIKTAFLVIFISLYANGMREVNIILKSIIAGAVILTILLLFYTPLGEWGSERLGAEFGMNQNEVGMIYVLGAALCLHYSRKNSLFILLFAAFVVISMFTGSRTSFLLMLLLIFSLILTRIKKPSDLLYIIPFGLLIFALIFLSMNNELLYNVLGVRMEGLFNILSGEGKVDSSAMKRMLFIEIGIEWFFENAIIGYGLNSFKSMNKLSGYSHNNYIELLVNFGLIGAIIYYSLPVITLIKSVHIWINKQKDALLPILLIIIVLISDIGSVSYYTAIIITSLTISYRMTALADMPTEEKPEQAVA